MASYKTIEAYNNYLVENQININIIEYVKDINKIKYILFYLFYIKLNLYLML
jgi:hypothetical protein